MKIKMKKWILFSILVFLLILFSSCQKQSGGKMTESKKSLPSEKIAPVVQSLDNKIDMAVKDFQKGEAVKGAELLLDAIRLVKPEEKWPNGFLNVILAAKEQFQSGNMSDFRKDISHALALIQPAHADSGEDAGDASILTDQRQREKEPAPIAQIFANMISSAKEEFKKGNADSGVMEILQALRLLSPSPK